MLDNINFETAPPLIQFIYAASIAKQPIGSGVFNEALEKHPEYFHEEVEHRRKWALVPQSIKDSYFNDVLKMEEILEKDVPHKRMGIMWCIDNPDKLNERQIALDKIELERKGLKKELHDKYFKQYGL